MYVHNKLVQYTIFSWMFGLDTKILSSLSVLCMDHSSFCMFAKVFYYSPFFSMKEKASIVFSLSAILFVFHSILSPWIQAPSATLLLPDPLY